MSDYDSIYNHVKEIASKLEIELEELKTLDKEKIAERITELITSKEKLYIELEDFLGKVGSTNGKGHEEE